MLPAIFGLAGESLTTSERAFFVAAQPAGFILFARNCRNRVQLLALTDELRLLTGRADVPILIDQEGGRIARLRPPEWPSFPAGARFDALYERAPISAIEAARLNALAIAVTLRAVGVNVDCAPLLDLRFDGAHDVIGDRALGDEPLRVAALGRAILDGLEGGGVLGIVKHVPGHGRAADDSHAALPIVEATREELERDIAPFRALNHAPIAMTAHVLYRAWDTERCASQSPFVIQEVIRGRIGFEGLLISDDVGMEALAGPVGDRAHAVVAAGCDLALHCSGVLAEMEAVAGSLPEIAGVSSARLDRALKRLPVAQPCPPYEELAARRDALLALSA